MGLHTGKPENPGIICFHTGSVIYGKTEKVRQDHYLSHRISKLYGVSIGASLFIGFIVFSDSTTESIDTPFEEGATHDL